MQEIHDLQNENKALKADKREQKHRVEMEEKDKIIVGIKAEVEHLNIQLKAKEEELLA